MMYNGRMVRRGVVRENLNLDIVVIPTFISSLLLGVAGRDRQWTRRGLDMCRLWRGLLGEECCFSENCGCFVLKQSCRSIAPHLKGEHGGGKLIDSPPCHC